MVDALLADLAVIFGVAVLVVLGVARVGLPPIAGFLLAGILVGPHALGLVADPHQVEVLAELGVALLLFTIGLEFSLERLKTIWRYVVLGGGLQVVLTVLWAVAGVVALGGPWKTGVFFGYLAALSSTAIVLSALTDRQEVSAPHGRFVIAVLIFQDLCIVPMMLTLPMLSGEGTSGVDVALTLGKAAVVVVGILAFARVIVPRVLRRAAATRRRELFLLTVLVVAIAVAVGTSKLGLSLAMGAFLAGVVIADTEFVHQATSDVAPFRDALASVFFVSIGMLLDVGVVWAQAGVVAALFVVLLVGKLGLATLAGLLMRFPARVALVAGVSLAQVGEFSFVLLRSGEQAGLVDAVTARVFIAASVLTMIATPLMVAASPHIGSAGERLLRPLERLLAVPEVTDDETPGHTLTGHVIVAGLGLGGQLLLSSLVRGGVPYVALELNPDTVRSLRGRGLDVRYGDVSSLEVLQHVAHADRARLLVLMLSDPRATERAAAVARHHFPDMHVVVRVQRATAGAAGQQAPPDVESVGVEVVSEDLVAAREIVERVMRRVEVSPL